MIRTLFCAVVALLVYAVAAADVPSGKGIRRGREKRK
jgi:hypothetical protein